MYEKLNIIFEEVVCEVHAIFQPPVDVQSKERRNVYIALWSFLIISFHLSNEAKT